MIFVVFLFSRSKDKSEPTIDDNRQSTCENDLSDYEGTACCLERRLTAVPEQIISVNYFTNIEKPEYEWEVLGGSMVLVEGEHSSTAKFRVGKNFIQDTIRGESYSIDGGCSDIIVITSGNN